MVWQGQNLHVKIQRLSNRSIDFDLVGVDASIANAFRRILIAEVCLIFPQSSLSYFVIQSNKGAYYSHRTGIRLG